jgi:hypothetical protein
VSILSVLNPESLAIKAAVVVLAVGTAFGYGHHVGYKGEKVKFDGFVSEQKAIAEKQVADNAAALKSQAAKYDADIATIKADHDAKIQHVQTERDSALADSATSAERLRRYIAGSGVKPATMPKVAASTGGANSAGNSGLPDGVSDLNRYLINQFSAADAIAVTLNEAEQVIAKDREVCNGQLPGVSN